MFADGRTEWRDDCLGGHWWVIPDGDRNRYFIGDGFASDSVTRDGANSKGPLVYREQPKERHEAGCRSFPTSGQRTYRVKV